MVAESSPTSEAPRQKRFTLVGCIIEAAILIVAVVIIYLLRVGVFETAIVTSGSMEPTLYKDDRVLVDHRATLHDQWKRGNILLFKSTGDWGEDTQLITKRIIGLPGEDWEIRNGDVYINGKLLAEKYLKEAPEAENYSGHLGSDQYFVMGDNRRNSEDSRVHGPIEDKDIEGRVLYVVAPLSRWGRVPDPGY